MSSQIIVLGAGFQGVCVALGLAHKGYSVALVDKADDCLLRTSLRNEGKIHLGLVYANDPTFKTARLMLESAFAFSRLLDRWVEADIPWRALRSEPFVYAITEGSMVPSHKLLEFYETLQEDYQEQLTQSGHSYLDSTAPRIYHELKNPAFSSDINPAYAERFISTAECAIDLVLFRGLLREALNQSTNITTVYGYSVKAITRTPEGFRVEGARQDGTSWRKHGCSVVNCLWDNRLSIDGSLGIRPPRKWAYRLKYRLLGHLPEALNQLPSMTFVLGPYGDLVTFQDRPTYFSWYPTCMRGWSSDLTPPEAWQAACEGRLAAGFREELIREVMTSLDEVIPGVSASSIEHVDAGIIFSWGTTDVDDPESELHQRHQIGVEAHDGYFSINTGKFTCAPLFAQRLLDQFF